MSWKNFNNSLSDKDIKYTPNDFIIGSLLSKVDEIERIIPSDGIALESTGVKNRLKVIAKERGIRQKEICDKLDISKSHLSQIFNNRLQPNTELFYKIWIVLDCPPFHKCFYFED